MLYQKLLKYKYWFFGVSLLVAGCNSSSSGRLEAILEDKQLVVITRNAPTTWYEDRDGQAGFEFELVTHFADYLGVRVKIITRDNVGEILEALNDGDGDIAAAGLTKTSEREDGFLFGPGYQEVKQQLVCRRGGARPKKIEELIDIELSVLANSSYAERLEALKVKHRDLEWNVIESANTEDLLEQVWQQKIDCTIADSNIVAVNRRYLPELSVRFDIGKADTLAWMMRLDAGSLNNKVQDWFDEIKRDGVLEKLTEKYYGHINKFDYVDTRALTRKIKRVLPKYKDMFIQAGKKHEINWTLLAAQSYQESHWNPRAKSPTGVRGMMMLTLPTARELGVESRLDAYANIMGGAKYLAKLMKRLPEDITGEDRIWMALAAYNIGYGHLRDAFELAQRENKNPYLWVELQEVLPLLAKKKYYKTLKYGYARGWEPVRYVNSIRDYEDIIKQHLGEKSTTTEASL
ncbi:MAG: membrane-bound lytic murein transglycosylase MltF [Gammaproteobacteria bacterium]|nr:membrane-bound lytic murein transglycosylase MltF [Gammaproteobacteria bacterium]